MDSDVATDGNCVLNARNLMSSKGDAFEAIEVTPAMVDAGIEAFWLFAEDRTEVAVRQIFVAMDQARPRSRVAVCEHDE